MKIQGESADSGKVAGALENAERGSRGFLEIFIRMIPVNLSLQLQKASYWGLSSSVFSLWLFCLAIA